MERANCAPAPRLSNEMARKPSQSVQAGFLEVEWTGGPLLINRRWASGVKTLASKPNWAWLFTACIRASAITTGRRRARAVHFDPE